ncbi:MAG: YceI family protein [Alphaproteobacteria bacterium]
MRTAIKTLLASVFLLLLAAPASAKEVSYFAPAPQIRVGMQLVKTRDLLPEDKQPPAARFTNATAGFHFDVDALTLSNLRITIASGGIATPDKDYTWLLLGPAVFDISNYEEIAFRSDKAAPFVNGAATIDGQLIIRGLALPFKLEAKLRHIEDSPLGVGIFGSKGRTIGISFRTEFECSDFGIVVKDDNANVLGDKMTLTFDMFATRQ